MEDARRQEAPRSSFFSREQAQARTRDAGVLRQRTLSATTPVAPVGACQSEAERLSNTCLFRTAGGEETHLLTENRGERCFALRVQPRLREESLGEPRRGLPRWDLPRPDRHRALRREEGSVARIDGVAIAVVLLLEAGARRAGSAGGRRRPDYEQSLRRGRGGAFLRELRALSRRRRERDRQHHRQHHRSMSVEGTERRRRAM